ncbi:MAG: hypothetical protein QME81_18180 [bacterium]|nr:hypothetical protein [bacterium]
MSVKERSITINGRTFNTFEKFYNYMDTHRASKEKAICTLKEKLKFCEQKYQISSEEFINTIGGTSADDIFDFIRWLGHYRSYRNLTDVSSFPHHKHYYPRDKYKPVAFSGNLIDFLQEVKWKMESQ